MIRLTMHDAIAAHRAAWQAYQSAEPGDATVDASDAEFSALDALLKTIPTSAEEVAALGTYLDWWVVEEVQRREVEPELFALQAVLALAGSGRPAA